MKFRLAATNAICSEGEGRSRYHKRTHFDVEVTNLALQITNREVNGMAGLTLGGRIVLGEESSALRKNVIGLLDGGNKKILLNVDRVGYIDSAGLGMLVAMYHAAKSHGASLALCHLGSHFQGVLQMTKLLTVFDTYKTETDAVCGLAS